MGSARRPPIDRFGKDHHEPHGCFFAASWAAAALLYFGQHSLPLTVLSGVVVLAGFDLLRP